MRYIIRSVNIGITNDQERLAACANCQERRSPEFRRCTAPLYSRSDTTRSEVMVATRYPFGVKSTTVPGAPGDLPGSNVAWRTRMVVSNICVHAPGRGQRPRIRLRIWSAGLFQHMRASASVG